MGRSGPSSRGSGRAGDALETRLENGCSTHGLDDVPPETRAAVLALRASWKFFSVQSFCHTFRAVLRLPNFTGDELERALMDPASEPFIVEVILRLLEDAPSRGPRLAVNDWEARLADKIQRIANESDYFEEDYPPTTVAAPSEEVADDVAPEGAAEAEGEDAPREEEDAPSSLSGPASSSTSEEAVVYGHPLQNGRAFFEHLTAMERLDVVAALCEECLDANEASRAEVEAMAAAHAVADGAHPEAHGDAVATDAENRAYHACGEDVRLYRWERPGGKGKNDARGGSSLDPAFATPCVTLGEVRALAASLGDPPARKDRALRDYLLQHHIPPHEALEAKAERARLAEAARAEEREVRRLAREAYDATDRKRSGRIARKIAEDLERRRIAAEAEEAEAEVRAIVQARDERLALERWRWMLLPPRLRPDEAPEGMSDGRDFLADGNRGKTRWRDLGAAAVGSYVKIHWDADGAWYPAAIESFDEASGTHAVRYLADDALETLRLDEEKTRAEPRERHISPAGLPVPPPETQLPGLERRGVRNERRSPNVLFVRETECDDDGLRRAGEGEKGDERPGLDTSGAGRKKYACRTCLENGVANPDHAKFSRKCPYHREYVGTVPEPQSSVEAVEEDAGEDEAGDASGRARETSSPEGGPEAEARAARGGGPVPWEARDEDARGGSDAPTGPSPVPLRVS